MICALCNIFTQKVLDPVEHLVPSAFLIFKLGFGFDIERPSDRKKVTY